MKDSEGAMPVNPRTELRAGRTVIGFVIGFVLGLWSPVGPLPVGVAGALLGFASAGATAAGNQRVQIIRSFLGEALRSGDLDEATHARLQHRLLAIDAPESATARTGEVSAPETPVQEAETPVSPPPPPFVPARPVSPERDRTPTPVPAAPPPAAGPTPVAPRPPFIDFSPLLRPIVSFWRSLRADFGVQGLGSLGVLLVFTATLGFVVFAFSEVGAAFRPVAELMVPVVLFGMSHFLRTRQAPFMASALEGLGGAVTPIMAFAAFTDGAPVPPDVERAALVVALTMSSLALAGVYGWVSLRRPSSPLRYLVAPLVWVAVGVVGMAINKEASAALCALVLVAVGVTPWVLARRAATPLQKAAFAMVVPGLVTAYTLLLVFGLAEAWPLWPVVIGGFAATAALEGSRDRVPRIWIAEAGLVALTGLAASVQLGVAWAGVAVVTAALALLERWVRDDEGRVIVRVVGSVAGGGLVAAAAGPGALLAAGLVLGAWGHVRRLAPTPNLDVVPAIVAATAPAIAAFGLGWLTEPWIGLLASAGVLLAVAAAARVWAPDDAYLATGVPVYGAAIGMAALAIRATGAATGFTIGDAVALAAAAGAVAVVPGRAAVRVWLGSVLAVGAWSVLAAAADLALQTTAYGLAGAGLALVLAGRAVPGRAGGHLAASGHVIGAVALPLVVFDAARIGVLAVFIAAWMIEIAAQPSGSPLQRLAGDPDTLDTSWLAAAPVLAGLPLLAMAITAEARPSAGRSGIILVLAGSAVAYGVVAGLPVWRRALSLEAVAGGVVASAIGMGLASELDPIVASERALQAVALGAGIVGVVASGRRATPWMHWYGWTLSLPLALVGGLAAGVPASELHWVATAWGIAASVGALVIDDAIAGRRAETEVRTQWLMAPAALGTFGAVGGIAVGLATTIDAMWPVALVATVWTGVMAYLVHNAPVTLFTWSMAALGYGSALYAADLAPLHDPLLMTWPALLALAGAVALPRKGRWTGRLDVPPLAVGLGVGAIAVGAGAAASATAVTWAPIGGALIVVAAVKREWIAVAPIGAVLVIGAAAIAGPWWLTAALAVHAAALAVIARLQDEFVARLLQWLSALLGAGSWASFLWALDASFGVTATTTSLVGAIVAAASAAVVAGNPDGHRHGMWTLPWASVAFVGSVMVAAQAVGESAGVEVRWVVAAAALVWAVSAVVAATMVGIDGVRFFATVVTLGVVASVGWAAGLTLEGWAIWVLASAVAMTTVAAVAADPIARLGWRTWMMSAAGGLHLVGVGLAAFMLPDRGLLVLALLAAAGAALVADLVYEFDGARFVAPGFVFGAWIAFITDAAAFDIQWYAPPFALAVIVDLEMLRRRRRHRHLDPDSTEEMIVVELIAVALAVGPALLEVVFADIRYGLLAIVWGTIVAIWGTATRVRRRVLAGAGSAALGALLMIAVPLAELVPAFRGAALWGAVFAIGAVLIVIAATLEQTRRRIVELKTSFATLTDGWE